MATSWNSQIQPNCKYSIQFETDDRKLYKLVEQACQRAIDISMTNEEYGRLEPHIREILEGKKEWI